MYDKAAILTTILTVNSTAISSLAVTQSPRMMGGVNVAAAVAIPVVLVLLLLLLLLLVIGVMVVVVLCVRCYKNQRKGLQLIMMKFKLVTNYSSVYINRTSYF